MQSCNLCKPGELDKQDRWILACRCNENLSFAQEWRWAQPEDDRKAFALFEDNKSVVFHPRSSLGTAVVRGSDLLSSGIHYWELKVTSPVYGTDVMFGIGLADVCLTAYSSRFVSFLGLDNKTWGLGYRGHLQHNSHITYLFGASFSRGDLVGCLLDLWHGKLTFFVNRTAVTDPIQLPLGSYYPMVCSTAARSGFRIIFSKSYDISLQLLTLLSLKASLNNLSTIFDLPGLPPALQTFYQDSLPWLFYKSYKLPRPEPYPFPDITLKLRRLIDVRLLMHSGRPSSGDRARIRRAMHTSRRQTTEVGYISPLSLSSSTPPSSSLADPLRSQSQPPSGDASVRSELSRQRSGEGLLHTESTSYVNARVSTVAAPASPCAISTSGNANHLRARYRSASSISSASGQRRSTDFGVGGAESFVGSEDSSTSEFHPIGPRDIGGSTVAGGALRRSEGIGVTGPPLSSSAIRTQHVSIEAPPSPQPPPESPVVFRLRQESATALNPLATAKKAVVVNHDPESDHDLYPSESSRLPFRGEDQVQRVFHSLNEMRRQHLLCDVVLKAGSVEVPAHKNVLAASSPYFHAMFTGDMTESRARTVTIGNIDGTALGLLVDFIYTAEVLITEETVQCLLPAANLLQLTSVREACCEFLQCQLHPTNCLGIQRFADMHDCSELLHVSRRFTEQHCGEVLEHGEEFLSLSKEQLVNLISSDHIRVSEEQVFEAALRWIRHDPAARGTPEVAAEVCGHVRFGLLPRDYLIRLSLSEEFLHANPWCKDFLLEAMGFLLLPWEQRRRNITSERTRPRSIGIPKTLLVLGGQAPKAIRSVESYDFTADKWVSSTATNAAGGGAGAISDLPTRRCRCGVAVVGGLIYVIGGFNGALRVRSVDIYDPVRNTWRAGPSLECRRSTLGVAVLDGVIYAVGGFNGTHGFASVEALDPWSGTWKSVAPMSVPRSSVGVGVLGRRLYAVGGYDGSSRRCLSSVECYNPLTNQWSAVADMNHRRSGPAVADLAARIYAVGGHDGLLVRSSVEYFDPRIGVWCSVVDMHHARRNAGLVSHNGMLYVVGGDDGSTSLDTTETYDPNLNAWTVLSGRLNIARCYCGVALIDCIAQAANT
ncbi:Kelch-like protein 3 [Taenia crassiceps]|uniref:Kelch-like protein 3 n=1 Tax=Taenia crassiceps TaxID=6207 RepID=A0ABR4Q105_9CEST